MAAALLHRVLAILVGLGELLAAYPLVGTIYLAGFTALGALTMWLLWRGEMKRAFWCATAVILVHFLFSWGDDTFTHVYRITALADQLRHGSINQFLVNPTTGETLPVFVYYNVLPYVIPTILNLAGMPAVYAFKLVMCGLFVVMAAGLQALIARTAVAGAKPRQGDLDQLAAFLFITANYVYCLWCSRSALAELWVYCLVPWVVNAVLTPRGERSTTVLLFLQVCGHPVVLLQSLVAEAVVTFSLSRMGWADLVRRGAVPAAMAVVLAVPFWLPQFLWQGWILGPNGLSWPFYDSFQNLRETISPHNMRSIGVWMPLALLLLIAVARARLSIRSWVATAACFAIIALQTVYLYPVARLIPTLELSIFVWRLAFPAAFLAFGALLAGWREVSLPPRQGLVPIAILSTACMMAVLFGIAPAQIAVASKGMDDRRAFVDYNRGDTRWGVHEFFPNYANLPRACDNVAEARRATDAELRAGLKVERPFLVVRHAPVGLVDYRANGATLEPAACDADLVLGPLPPGGIVTVTESKVDALLWTRLLGFFAALLLIWRVVPLFGRLRPAT
jgi:hypothetical protein